MNICLIKGNFSFVLYITISQVTILNFLSQLSCCGLLWSTSNLPLAQATYRLKKQIYYSTWLCKNQLQITLSTYVQEAKKRVEGASAEGDTAHQKASGAPFCCRKSIYVHWLDWPQSPCDVSTPEHRQRHSAPDLQRAAGLSRTLTGLWKLLPSSMTRMPSITDLPLIPTSGKNPIETLYNPWLCLSNLGT